MKCKIKKEEDEISVKVDSFEKACDCLYSNGTDYSNGGYADVTVHSKHHRAISALNKLITVAEARNRADGSVPDFSDSNRWKHYPLFVPDGETANFTCADSYFAASNIYIYGYWLSPLFQNAGTRQTVRQAVY
ncbi:MAG: hypothetical protein LBB73_06425 [Dysgonamonadaceae bacterium]|jgi:hypothetical protein|nr:hypothetical protein [Dysgonamonadaceae bacterium]